MNRKLVLTLGLVMAFALTSCENKNIETREINQTENSEKADTSDVIETDIIGLDTENTEVETVAKVCNLNFSTYDVFYAEAQNEATPLSLTLVTEEPNKISKMKDWFLKNELFLPMLSEEWEHHIKADGEKPTISSEVNLKNNVFYDENYIYEWSTNLLNIYDMNTNQLLYTVSYYSNDWYSMGNCAYLRDGILYICSIYNGYAEPGSCFLLAYDLENENVVWRSEDQTYNSMNFIVKDDVIICGYGFTDEQDYIYQIDINTGKVISQTELKKMPDLLVEKDGQLYVHTYSYDYVFDMK